MNWDDLRFVLALSKEGSLARAGKKLRVDHTTVGRRIDAAESALGVRLFTRTTKGYVPTAEAEGLLEKIRSVEEGVLALERGAHAAHERPEGTVRVTSPETFGVSYLAPRLARIGAEHPGLTIELTAGGTILDLSRREADVAVRFFRSDHESLVVRRGADVAYGLYASPAYLAQHPVGATLDGHRLLGALGGPNVIDAAWIARIAPGARPAFACDLSIGLAHAAREGAGLAVLPRYLGDADPGLRHVPRADEPRETVWITVHRDLRNTPRVRVVLDHLAACLEHDRALLAGSVKPRSRARAK